MDEMEGPVVQIAMGLPQAILLGTALGLFIVQTVEETNENPLATEEDQEDYMDTLASKMIAMEMFAGLSRTLEVPEDEISAMMDRLSDGVRLGDEGNNG